MALKLSDLRTDVHQDWCPGCGDYGILASAQMALKELDVPQERIALFSGVGCHGKIHHFMNVSGAHTLHGRALPYALGTKLANPNLEVLCFGGDGDGLGIGVGHFVHAGRRNIDMTYAIHDNGVYGLTKGQASPTLGLDLQTKSLPEPNINNNVNPVALALASGVTFIARSYAFDTRHLADTLKKAVLHKGFAVVIILQPCPTYNDIETRAWYSGEDHRDSKTNRPIPRVYKLESEGYDPLVKDGMTEKERFVKMSQALEKAQEWGDEIPVGVFYQDVSTSSYAERILRRIPSYLTSPPATQTIAVDGGRPAAELSGIYAGLTV